MRRWLSRLLAKWAGRLSVPEAQPYVAPQAGIPTSHASPRFTVARWKGDRHWYAYHGPDGGEARRVFEGVIERRESGRMEFWQNTGHSKPVVRGTYDSDFDNN